MKPAHAIPSILHRLCYALTLGVLAAGQGPMAQASQSPPPAATPLAFPLVLERAGQDSPLLALDRFRQQTYNRPSWGAPGWTRGGAARGGCNVDDAPLVPLVPLSGDGVDEVAFLGLTGSAAPEMLVYVPDTPAKSIELLVMDPNIDRNQPGEVIYQQQQLVSEFPGILKFDLAAAETELTPDRDYLWMFSMVCDPLDPSGNPYVRGLIKRVNGEPEMMVLENDADPYDLINAYAEAGLWHETVASLGELYCDRPNDPEVAQDWQDLMFSLELSRAPELLESLRADDIAAAPLLFCAE